MRTASSYLGAPRVAVCWWYHLLNGTLLSESSRRGLRPEKNEMPTKKLSSRKKVSDEMRSEYDFSNARPNRFAKQFNGEGGGVLVLLAPDVAEVFDSSKKVNRFLRATLSAVKK